MPKKIYTLDIAEKLSKAMREQPPKPKSSRTGTTSDVIQSLAKDIRLMQDNGYTFKEVVELLGNNGFKISVATLKSALARIPDAKRLTKKDASSAEKATATTGDKPASRQARPARLSALEVQNATPAEDAKQSGKFQVKPDRQTI